MIILNLEIKTEVMVPAVFSSTSNDLSSCLRSNQTPRFNAEVCVLFHNLIAKKSIFRNPYFLKMDKTTDWLKEGEFQGKKGVILLLYVQPGASRTRVQGVYADQPVRLKISVQAPPVEGAANEAVIDWLAKLVKFSQSKIHLIRGHQSRKKDFFIEGLSRSLILDSLK